MKIRRFLSCFPTPKKNIKMLGTCNVMLYNLIIQICAHFNFTDDESSSEQSRAEESHVKHEKLGKCLYVKVVQWNSMSPSLNPRPARCETEALEWGCSVKMALTSLQVFFRSPQYHTSALATLLNCTEPVPLD